MWSLKATKKKKKKWEWKASVLSSSSLKTHKAQMFSRWRQIKSFSAASKWKQLAATESAATKSNTLLPLMEPKKFKVCRLKVMTALRHSWLTSQHVYTNTNVVFVLTAFCIWYERHSRVRFCESDLSPMVSTVASAIRLSVWLSPQMFACSPSVCVGSLGISDCQFCRGARGKEGNASVHTVIWVCIQFSCM